MRKSLSRSKILSAIKYIIDNICTLMKKALGPNFAPNYKTKDDLEKNHVHTKETYSQLLEISELIDKKLKDKQGKPEIKKYVSNWQKEANTKGFGRFAKFVGEHHNADLVSPDATKRTKSGNSRSKK